MKTINRYAVFGYPLKHSKSPRIHQLFAEQTGQSLQYNALEVTGEQFLDAAKTFFAKGGKGLNCTVPLKELAFAFADTTTDRARHSKAVNTLTRLPDGRVLGDNTDGCGLIRDLIDNQNIKLSDKRILILGAGGATRGILAPLLEQTPQKIVISNRTVEKAITLAVEFSGFGPVSGCGFDDLRDLQFDLIINATSASLLGQLPPLPEAILAESGCCYDLAYGNDPTAFVCWARERRAAKSLDGLGMLVEQAAEAFYLWHEIRPKTRPVLELLNSERMGQATINGQLPISEPNIGLSI